MSSEVKPISWQTKLYRFRCGIYVTICTLLNITVPEFEEQRFIHIKASGGIQQAKILIISFAGSTLVVGGFPRPEFKNSLMKAANESGIEADLLFVADPSQAFYLKDPKKGVFDSGEYYVQNLKELTKNYNKVIAIGSSMGATGILHLAPRFKCDTALVFNPLVDVRSDTRFMFWLGGLRLPKKLRDILPGMIKEGFRREAKESDDQVCRLVAHFSGSSAGDDQQRKVLEDLLSDDYETKRFGEKDNGTTSQGHVLIEHDSEIHVLPRELHSKGLWNGLLVDAISEAAC